MQDIPLTKENTLEYGKLSDDIPSELKDCLLKCHDKMTIRQLHNVGDFCYNKASKLREGIEDHLTIEDFEKVKSSDIDNDQEEEEEENHE